MKKTILACAALLLITMACDTKETMETGKDAHAEQVVGADQDDHDCIASAGQTWSILKQECIQVFNDGVRLNPIDPDSIQMANSSTSSAFVVLDKNKSKAELFLPDQDGSIILNQVEDAENEYVKTPYKFDERNQSLYVNNEKKYKAEK